MNIRHLVIKSFDGDNIIRKSVIFDGTPIITQEQKVEKNTNVVIDFSEDKKVIESIKLEPSIIEGRESLLSSPLKDIVARKNGDIKSLSTIFGYKVGKSDIFSEAVPVGTEFTPIFESDDVRYLLESIATNMFSNVNPKTGKLDIDVDDYTTRFIPLVVLTDTIPPQVENDNIYYNPKGTVSIAEFLDGLNAIKYGMNSNKTRKKTLDNISTEDDYFNEGYNECLRGMSSFFYNLYTREELLQPITRCEMAYIITLCWNQFLSKYSDLYGGRFYLGYTFDWEHPLDSLICYKDGTDYKISKIVKDEDMSTVSLDLREYKGINTMGQYKQNMLSGTSPIPIALFMPLIELDNLGVFNFETESKDGFELAPLKEVSRGELAYVLTQLARLFPLEYTK